MKVGDLVSAPKSQFDDFDMKQFFGLVVWTDGYKVTLLVDGLEETWTTFDLKAIGAKVIS